MRIYYLPDGEVEIALYDKDVYGYLPTSEAQVLSVDEVPDNRTLCVQMAKMAKWRDANGLGRWYVQGGELYERDGWAVAAVIP